MSKYNRIGEALKLKERSKLWLAKKIGVSPNTINSWIKGKNEPNLTQINNIANVLEMSNLDLIKK